MANSEFRIYRALSRTFRSYRTVLNNAPLLHDWGVLRWRGTVRRSVRLRDQKAAATILSGSVRILVDYNERKSTDAASVWNPVNFLNPYWLRPSLCERLLLLISLGLPRNAAKSLRACALALTIRSRLPRTTDLVAWNPYSVFHHAIIDICEVSETYLLSPKYPLPNGRTKFLGHRVLKDIYSLNGNTFTATKWNTKITSDEARVALYFTKLCERDPREERLKEFGLFLIRHSVPIAIYLHYVDRDQATITGLGPELLPAVKRVPSVEDISSNQISVSGVSTIGLELLSADLAHFVCFGASEDQSSIPLSSAATPFRHWIMNQPCGLSRTSTDHEWVAQILRAEPERGRWLSEALYGGGG